jgi:hypothetical protein
MRNDLNSTLKFNCINYFTWGSIWSLILNKAPTMNIIGNRGGG